MPLDGDISYTELASAVGVDETNIRRVVRHAMTNRLFREPRDGYVAHTAASRVLRDDEQMIGWVGVNCSEFFPASAKTVDSMIKYPASQEPSESGFSLAHAPGVPMFAVLGKEPARAKRMGAAMISLTGGEGYEPEYLVDGYPWGELGEAVVVDVRDSLLSFPMSFKLLTADQVGRIFWFRVCSTCEEVPQIALRGARHGQDDRGSTIQDSAGIPRSDRVPDT